MESQIVFLGTGGDSTVIGKQLRAGGGFVVQCNDLQLHIDPGPGSLKELKLNNINVRETTALLVSHAHTNHANDTKAIVEAMTLGGLDSRGVLVCNETSFSGTKEIAPIVNEFHKNCLERIIVIKPGQILGIGDVEITALPAYHSVPALGFKITTENFTLVYTGDTSYGENLYSFYKNADILVLNLVAPAGFKIEHNLNGEDAAKIIKKSKPRLAIITHFGIKMLNEDPMYQAREIHKKSGVTVIAAEDGLVINPKAYAIRKRQKRLSSF